MWYSIKEHWKIILNSENITTANLSYLCFVPVKELVRGLLANSSNISLEVPLASKWWWWSGLISPKDSQLRYMPFHNLKKVWEFLKIYHKRRGLRCFFFHKITLFQVAFYTLHCRKTICTCINFAFSCRKKLHRFLYKSDKKSTHEQTRLQSSPNSARADSNAKSFTQSPLALHQDTKDDRGRWLNRFKATFKKFAFCWKLCSDHGAF